MPIYLKFDPVPGTSDAQGHVGWIELQSCSFAAPPASTEKTTIATVNCVKLMDASSSSLMLASQQGNTGIAMIDFVKSNSDVYLSLALVEASITGYSTGGRNDGQTRMETFSISSRGITIRSKKAGGDDAADHAASAQAVWGIDASDAAGL